MRRATFRPGGVSRHPVAAVERPTASSSGTFERQRHLLGWLSPPWMNRLAARSHDSRKVDDELPTGAVS